MYKILLFIYAFGGLIIIVGTASFIWDVFRGNTNIRTRYFPEKYLAVFAAMAIFAPAFWYATYIHGKIPDGTYQVIASVRRSSSDKIYYQPTDITVYTDTDYEDSRYYLGAAEMESSRVVSTQRFFIERIYWSSDHKQYSSFYDQEVRPESEFLTTAESGDEYYINIGVITPEILGISKMDVWKNLSALAKIEPVLISLCCIFNIWQFLHGTQQKYE